MSFKMTIELKDFPNQQKAIEWLKRKMEDLGSELHHNPFDEKDEDIYAITITDPSYDNGKKADIAVIVTRKQNPPSRFQ